MKSLAFSSLVFVTAGLSLLPAPVAAQAIIGTVGGSSQAVVFPTPNTGLPTPTQVNVPGLPPGAAPHGVGYFGSDNALVSNFGVSELFVIQISTSSLVSTIPTSPHYDGTGTNAIAPSLTAALAAGATGNVAVIAAPFGPSSAITSVPLTGFVASYQTQAIVFNAAGRAFVHQNAGISVMDPPYASVAFTIPTTWNSSSGAIAITPDGNQLLATNLNDGIVRIYTAPYSAASVPVDLAIAGASFLDGIFVTPDGSQALVVSATMDTLFAISAPYSAASIVDPIPLPGVTWGGFEDVGISADGQLAILTGNDTVGIPDTPFIRAPFTSAGATLFDVSIPGGRGAGAVRFLPPGLAPGLTITKSAPSTVSSGANLTYTITYGNTGSANASSVVIQDTVPAGTTFVSATGGGTLAAGVVTWNIGPLNAGVTGQTVDFTVSVTATSGTVDNNAYSIEATGVPAIPGPPVTTTILGSASFCFGDGSGVACPCTNNGASGNGCANSDHPGGANLSIGGNASLAADTLVLTAVDIHASSLVLFVQADTEIAPQNFGDGLSCLGGLNVRLFRTKGAHATTVSAPALNSMPPSPATISGESATHGDVLSAGSVRGYQVHYRDPSVGFCPTGGTFNLTNAVRATWGP